MVDRRSKFAPHEEIFFKLDVPEVSWSERECGKNWEAVRSLLWKFWFYYKYWPCHVQVLALLYFSAYMSSSRPFILCLTFLDFLIFFLFHFFPFFYPLAFISSYITNYSCSFCLSTFLTTTYHTFYFNYQLPNFPSKHFCNFSL